MREEHEKLIQGFNRLQFCNRALVIFAAVTSGFCAWVAVRRIAEGRLILGFILFFCFCADVTVVVQTLKRIQEITKEQRKLEIRFEMLEMLGVFNENVESEEEKDESESDAENGGESGSAEEGCGV